MEYSTICDRLVKLLARFLGKYSIFADMNFLFDSHAAARLPATLLPLIQFIDVQCIFYALRSRFRRVTAPAHCMQPRREFNYCECAVVNTQSRWRKLFRTRTPNTVCHRARNIVQKYTYINHYVLKTYLRKSIVAVCVRWWKEGIDKDKEVPYDVHSVLVGSFAKFSISIWSAIAWSGRIPSRSQLNWVCVFCTTIPYWRKTIYIGKRKHTKTISGLNAFALFSFFSWTVKQVTHWHIQFTPKKKQWKKNRTRSSTFPAANDLLLFAEHVLFESNRNCCTPKALCAPHRIATAVSVALRILFLNFGGEKYAVIVRRLLASRLRVCCWHL